MNTKAQTVTDAGNAPRVAVTASQMREQRAQRRKERDERTRGYDLRKLEEREAGERTPARKLPSVDAVARHIDQTPSETDEPREWKRVLNRRLPDLRVLYSGETVKGFVYKLADTSTGKSQWCCNSGCGDTAKLIGHRWTLEQAKLATEEGIAASADQVPTAQEGTR